MRRGVTGCFERMSARDAGFVFDEEPRRLEMLVACYLFEIRGGATTAASEESLRRWVRARLGASDFLTRRIRRVPFDLGMPVLVPVPDVDLAEHVHLHVIDGGEAELRDTLAGIAKRRLDLDRPPWEVHAVTGARGVDGLDESVTVVLKVHHSVIDGMGMRALEVAMFSDTELPGPPARLRPAHPVETALHGILGAPWHLARFVHRVRKTRDDSREVARRIRDGSLPASEANRPETRFNTRSSGGLELHLATFPLSDIARARSVVPGATINDVLLTAVSGALRRLLIDLDEDPGSALAAMVPISLRLPDVRSGRQRADQSGHRSANQLILGTIDLHTDIADPAERMAAISRSAADEKAMWVDPQMRRTFTRSEVVPAWLLALRARLRRQTDPGANAGRPRLRNTMISNLPAPAGEPTFDGAPMRRSFGILLPTDGDRLRHLFATLGDRMTLSVTADPGSLPDPAAYLALVEDELAGLAGRGR